MKRILLAVLAGAGLVASAGAQAQQGWWNGPELGVQGGYGWGTTSGSTSGAIGAHNFSYSTSGGMGGGHAGYDWQMGQFVVGIQGLIEGGNISGSLTSATRGTTSSNIDWDGAIRGKAGVAFDRALVYAAGGVAFGDVHENFVGPFGSASEHDVRVGWTAGAGVAYKIAPDWDIEAEYRYTDLGSNTFTVGHGTSTITDPSHYSMITIGLTWICLPPIIMPAMATPIPAAVPAPPPPPMARTFIVFFDFDKYNLTPDARRVIEAAAAYFKTTGSARIDLSGYTDLAGTQAYNLRLSQHRADAVAAYLMRQGVTKNVIELKWFGKEHPRVPTQDGVREPQNRRVEIGLQ